jgi:hypothetical protein
LFFVKGFQAFVDLRSQTLGVHLRLSNCFVSQNCDGLIGFAIALAEIANNPTKQKRQAIACLGRVYGFNVSMTTIAVARTPTKTLYHR